MSGSAGRAPCRTAEFRALPSRAGQTRRITAAYLRYWGLGAYAEGAALGVTGLLEQVSPAPGGEGCAGEPCTVRAVLARGLLTLSVRVRGDGARLLPAPCRGEPGRRGDDPQGEEAGTGLALVAAVSESWGTGAYGDGAGTEVWCTLRVGAAMDAAPPPREGAAQPAGEEAAALLG